MKIREFKAEDREILLALFANTLETNSNYISHGEIQMGLSEDGHSLSADYKAKWLRYLKRQNDNPDTRIYVGEDNVQIAGFIIFGIENDFDNDYGVIYDIVLRDEYKGSGAADQLFRCAQDHFTAMEVKECFLESGSENHRAHSFFEKKGFRHVSNIYWLANISAVKQN